MAESTVNSRNARRSIGPVFDPIRAVGAEAIANRRSSVFALSTGPVIALTNADSERGAVFERALSAFAVSNPFCATATVRSACASMRVLRPP